MRFMHYLVLGCLLLGLAVQATHFRYSNIQWSQLPGTRSVVFTITSAWRRDFPDFRVGSRAAGDFVVGETVTETATYFLPAANSNGFLFTMLVNAVNYGSTSRTNVAQNWFIGVQTVTFTYGESLTAPVAFFQRCCRISTLVNNPDRWFRVETRLTVLNGKTRRGLEVSMLPIVTLFQNVARSFPIPVIALNATDVPTNGIRYRLATGDEAAGSGNRYTQAAGINGGPALSVDFVSGIVSWTPNNIGAYSTQIIVEGHTVPPTSTTDKSNMIVSHAIDFIVDVIAPSADNSPPTFTSFTSRTSLSSTVTTLTATTAGSFFTTVTLGATLTLVVTATDANVGDTVIVGNGAIPSGSNTTFSQNTNPGTLTFMWTPTATQLGSIVCFTAFDSRGLAAILNPCVTINVIAPDMSAEGIGLTYAVAGDQTTVFINNADSRQHSLTITGGTTSASAVIFNTGLQGRLSTQRRYNATYNHPWYPSSAVTKSGFYALTIKDETPGQSGLLLYTLQVVPSVTSAPNCDPYDLGSSGLSGGTAQKKVFFFVQSRDRFDNDVTENRSPSGTNVETMEADIIFNNVTTLALGEYQSSGIWKITYDIPNFNAEANYTLNIYLKRVVGGTRSLVETLNPKIQPGEFSVTLRTYTYVAGNPIYFEIEGISTKHLWTASVAGIPIPSENITIPTGSPFIYGFTSAEPFYVARSFPNANGIIATAPGLGSGLVGSSFEVIPAEPFGRNSLILSGVGDATAGETVEVSLQLFDVYRNMITSDDPDTFVSFYLSHPVEGSRSGNATWSETTFTYSFTYKYDLIGSLDMEIIVQSGSSAPQQVGESPFNFNIEPADFSVSRSRTGYSGTFAAGDTSSMIILARDSFNNERTEGDDKIRASFQLAGQEANFSYTATPIPGTNRYTFSYTSTVAGTYEVAIEAYVPQEFDYVPFTTERVIVTPGAVVPSNTQMSGDGWTESSLPAGSSQQVLSQARDFYENVVTEEREVIFVAKVTPQGSTTSTYFSSSYVAPIGGGACFGSVSSDYVIQNLQSTTTISAAEQLLAAEGYHKLSYTVPDNGRYTVELSLCNSTNTVGLVNARDMLDTGCESVGNQVLTSNARQTNFSFKDNYGAIAGTAIGGAIALGGLFYVGWRLHRYRPKYLAEKKRAEEAQAELEEIGKEVDIIPAHGENGELEPSKDEDLPPPSKSGTLKGVPVPKQQVDEAPDVKMDISRPQIRKEFAPVRPAAKTDAALAAPGVDPIAGAKSL